MSSPSNVFNLSSPHLHVTYSNGTLGSILGLTYQDDQQTLQFKDQELRRVSTDLGEEITVTLRMTVDMGSTKFTLIAPRVAIELNQHVPINTIGITTLHSFSLIPSINHGQLDSYRVARLQGTASSHPF